MLFEDQALMDRVCNVLADMGESNLAWRAHTARADSDESMPVAEYLEGHRRGIVLFMFDLRPATEALWALVPQMQDLARRLDLPEWSERNERLAHLVDRILGGITAWAAGPDGEEGRLQMVVIDALVDLAADMNVFYREVYARLAAA